jgi:hypothetical protein
MRDGRGFRCSTVVTFVNRKRRDSSLGLTLTDNLSGLLDVFEESLGSIVSP